MRCGSPTPHARRATWTRAWRVSQPCCRLAVSARAEPTYGEVVPSNPPDDSRQPDELQELLTLLGAAAQLAGCWLYVEDRFEDGTVRAAYDAPGFGALFGDTEPRRRSCGATTCWPRTRRSWRVWRRSCRATRSTSAIACAASTASSAWCATGAACSATAAGAVRVFGTVQDVTDEHEIRETVRRIGETIDEYYFTDELRPDGTYEPIFATAAIDRLLGGIPEGMTYGEAWHAAVHPDDRAAGRRRWSTRCAPARRSTSSTAWSASTASRAGSGCAARCARRSPTVRCILDGVAQDVTRAPRRPDPADRRSRRRSTRCCTSRSTTPTARIVETYSTQRHPQDCTGSARTSRCPTGGPTSTPRTVRSPTRWTPGCAS